MKRKNFMRLVTDKKQTNFKGRRFSKIQQFLNQLRYTISKV